MGDSFFVIIQIRGLEQYFHYMVLCIDRLCRVVLTCKSVDETLVCDNIAFKHFLLNCAALWSNTQVHFYVCLTWILTIKYLIIFPRLLEFADKFSMKQFWHFIKSVNYLMYYCLSFHNVNDSFTAWPRTINLICTSVQIWLSSSFVTRV